MLSFIEKSLLLIDFVLFHLFSPILVLFYSFKQLIIEGSFSSELFISSHFLCYFCHLDTFLLEIFLSINHIFNLLSSSLLYSSTLLGDHLFSLLDQVLSLTLSLNLLFLFLNALMNDILILHLAHLFLSFFVLFVDL